MFKVSLIELQFLLRQVLRLLHYLINIGCYGNTSESLNTVAQALMSILDGRSDLPYPMGRGEFVSSLSFGQRFSPVSNFHLNLIVPLSFNISLYQLRLTYVVHSCIGWTVSAHETSPPNSIQIRSSWA